ncbi:cytochrome c oxidase assembly factor CtaG [Sporosarcina sp. FSL K6-3457]|uniref:cytochrome c oxidase assembly factor CtaG n=1 Tax=Sporosarcina sp. FSL K6-3457 TaxID=2978204 RepID=UPI0030F4B9A8
MMPLSIFGFRALWSPWFLLIILIGIALYIFLATKMRHRFEGTESLTRKQFLLFLLSMVLLYAVKGSPVDLMGHILFTMHMVQMALLLLLVAPLLIIGIPNWMWKKVFDIKILARIIGVLTKPVISLIIFIGMFSIYHIPIILDSVKLSAPLHTIFTITLFLAAMLFWWPVINTLEGQPKLHGLKKIGYIILSAIFITPACSLIIFVDVPVYETYQSGEAWLKAMALCVPAGTLAGLSGLGISGPELFTNMETLTDQQLGGILMKVIQEIVYVFVIGSVFIKWYKEEQDNAEEITKKALVDLEQQRLALQEHQL